jgi:hypothetical protein
MWENMAEVRNAYRIFYRETSWKAETENNFKNESQEDML